MERSKVQALSKRFITKLADDNDPKTEVLPRSPYAVPHERWDTIPAPPPEETWDGFDTDYPELELPPPPTMPTMPSPSGEEYSSEPVNVGIELPVGEVMAAVPEQVFSEFLTQHAPESEGQMLVSLQIDDASVGVYSLTNIPGQQTPQIRKMDNVKPIAYSIDDFMTWLETNQPTTWWKAKQVMKKYQ